MRKKKDFKVNSKKKKLGSAILTCTGVVVYEIIFLFHLSTVTDVSV